MVRLAAPIAALVAVLALAGPAWASTVQIQDDAHVLNTTVVQNEAATLPVGVYIWTTTQDAASKSTFDTDVRNKVNATFPIAIGINTQSRHESIQIGSQARIARNAALAAESSASNAFLASMQSSHDYTTAVTAALGQLRTGLAGANQGSFSGRRVPVHNSGSGGGLVLILLVIGAIVLAVIFVGRRRRRSTRMAPPMMGSGPPPMGSYPGYGPSSGSGMSPGAAGAMGAVGGAVGGGLLGYELGKMQGEQQQFRQDEMMDRGGQYDSPDQGNWVVGQDGDFGGDQGSDSSGGDSSGGGDW
ncbi:MAG: hypothetical protein WAN20_25180 [Pseudonocardiaceae bacterium]|jgi:hypothetical protein|nr:hypothetical protein [Pseudonocardiaceae bacterium]